MNKKTLQIRKRFMRLAINEAKKGLGKVNPNPAVGCVIVKNNKVIAKGYHRRFGGPHAEAAALKKATEAARGAALYVTLEPCCHFGKTPPCTDAIIRAGVKEVVAAMVDPNPANSGRGFKQLRKNGVKVISGILKEEAANLNRAFIERMARERPFISVKMAQSLDGKIATREGDSKWISSHGSRAKVQKLRAEHDAIMVGINTVLKDDPSLNVRTSYFALRTSWRQPVKIIVDSRLRTPVNARIFSKDSPAKVIIATTKKAPVKKEKLLIREGAEVLRISGNSGRVDLKVLLKKLSKSGIGSILVEGGSELAASLFDDKLVDKIYFFIAPILIGGRDAITSVEGRGIKKIKDAFRLDGVKIKRVKKDFLIEGNVYRNS